MMRVKQIMMKKRKRHLILRQLKSIVLGEHVISFTDCCPNHLLYSRRKLVRNAKTGSLIDDSPLINGVGLVILVIFLIPGMVYGILSKQIKNSKDLGSMISDSLGSMGSFILIVFFAAQLLAFLQWSNLGIIVSVYGAKLLQHQNGIVLIIGIIILSGLINLIIGSASAKWGILAPIFVPMMILLGYHPAFTQMIYRVGDSITNPITPMMPYMPLVLSYAQKYDKNMKLGSLLSSLMPYTFALGVVWTLFVIAWYLLGIPLGPGGPVKIRNNIPLFTIFYTRYVHKPPLSSRRFIFV